MEQATILVVEDDPHMRAALRAALHRAGYPVEVSADPVEARAKMRQKEFALVLTDLKMPNGSGMVVLREVRTRSPRTPVILLTAHGTVETAVEAMKEGASDFIQKPFSFEDLQDAVRRALEASDGSARPSKDGSEGGILTQDPAVFQILKRAEAVAGSKVPVLIQGDSGTGKEVLARFIHCHSPRVDGPFVAINCAAIPEALLESELFGHEKGAFTGAVARKVGKFEQADGGTLLLDEIGEMNGNLQAKLLRVLQEWEVDRVGGRGPVPVDVRVVATTNADLAQCVRNGKFREDLYFRLNVIPLSLPPLRERPCDIPLLARHFLTRCARTHQKPVRDFTPRALEQLQSQGWRGNVRELKNVVERAVLLGSGPVLDAEDLWLEGVEGASPWPQVGIPEGSVKDVERGLILRTLEKERWNRTRASAKLGISIRTLRNKLQEYRREGFLSAREA
jgi:DNA-binding NtrC family response regulator